MEKRVADKVDLQVSTTTKPQVILVEGDPVVVNQIIEVFHGHDIAMTVTFVENLDETITALETRSCDLIISDWQLPDGSMIDFLTRSGTPPRYPVVIWTDRGNETLAVNSMQAGALNYVVKNRDSLKRLPFIARQAMDQWRHRENRRRASETLVSSEEKFSKAFRSSPIWVVISSLKDGRYIEVNDTFLKATGYTRDEVIGSSSMDLGIWADGKERDHVVELIRTIGSVRNLEVHRRDKQGRILTMLFSSEPITINGEECLVSVSLDISERKELETGLRQAQKMEAVGTLASGVAHDFNNILQAIGNNTQLLSLNKKADDPDQIYLQEIEDRVGRAAELVRQLLTLSRVVESRKEPLDLNAEIIQTCRLLERTLPKTIHLATCLTDNLWPIVGNLVQLEQVIINLASNARDAMPNGGRLTLSTSNVYADQEKRLDQAHIRQGRYVRFQISDDGQGMDSETLTHMYDPFYTTKEIGQGTGLGLTMVYGIVKEHDGLVFADSAPGRGTTFTIFFPASTIIGKPNATDQEETIPSAKGETILLVDDEPAIRDSCAGLIRHGGYQVLTAPHGRAALEIIQKKDHPIDLIILDINMPGMDGYQCLREIMKIDAGYKVLIASGYAKEIQTGQALTKGASGFIAKPYRYATLLRKIRHILDASIESSG
jgi:two-component system, cell cycle sensor histidine kinase and response regulator CckA